VQVRYLANVPVINLYLCNGAVFAVEQKLNRISGGLEESRLSACFFVGTQVSNQVLHQVQDGGESKSALGRLQTPLLSFAAACMALLVAACDSFVQACRVDECEGRMIEETAMLLLTRKKTRMSL
jgi:hypothetical protein